MNAPLYMLIAALFFSVMGAVVKFLAHIPFFELAFFRSLVIAVLCLPSCLKLGAACLGKPGNRRLLLARGIAGTIGLTLYFWTLQRLELSAAVTIQYTSPIFTILVAAVVLKERVTPMAFAFSGLAMLGVAAIYEFKISNVNVPVMAAGLVGALFSGCAYNCIRALQHREHSQVIVLYFPLVTLPVVVIPCFIWWQPLTALDLILLLVMGLSTYGAQYCLTRAYQIGPASRIAALGNLNVVFALIVGFVIFNEPIAWYELFGSAIILGSVYAIQRLGKAADRTAALQEVKAVADPVSVGPAG